MTEAVMPATMSESGVQGILLQLIVVIVVAIGTSRSSPSGGLVSVRS